MTPRRTRPGSVYADEVAQALAEVLRRQNRGTVLENYEAQRRLTRALEELDSGSSSLNSLPAELVSYLSAASELGLLHLSDVARERLHRRYAETDVLLRAHAAQHRETRAEGSAQGLLEPASESLTEHSHLRDITRDRARWPELQPGALSALKTLILRNAAEAAQENVTRVTAASRWNPRTVRAAFAGSVVLFFGPMSVVGALDDFDAGTLATTAVTGAAVTYALVEVLRGAYAHSREQVRERLGTGTLQADVVGFTSEDAKARTVRVKTLREALAVKQASARVPERL
jgi:hypothetical protein